MAAASSRKARMHSLVAKGGIYARLAKLQFDTGASAFQGAAE
jgi:ATP-binding cassette subfamily B protein